VPVPALTQNADIVRYEWWRDRLPTPPPLIGSATAAVKAMPVSVTMFTTFEFVQVMSSADDLSRVAV
jgi:hypothetical protein